MSLEILGRIHRIINDRIEKSKGRTNLTYWGKVEGFALDFYHGSNVGKRGAPEGVGGGGGR